MLIMKKKVIVRIIIVVMLLLFVPIPLHLKDGGTVVYRAVLYKLTKYHKIAMDTTVETEAGTIVESGHHVGKLFPSILPSQIIAIFSAFFLLKIRCFLNFFLYGRIETSIVPKIKHF